MAVAISYLSQTSMRMRFHLASFLLLFWISACSGGELTVKDAWARPALSGNNSAVYFVIENPTSEDDTLLGVSTRAAEVAEMHMSMAVESEHNTDHDMEGMLQGEVMTMIKQDNVPVPRRGEVNFTPGGLHVMLVGVSEDLVAGDTIEVTLTFKNAGTVILEVPVIEK